MWELQGVRILTPSIAIPVNETLGFVDVSTRLLLQHRDWTHRAQSDRNDFLLQAEAFVHQTLETRFVEDVVGEFFVGKHG